MRKSIYWVIVHPICVDQVDYSNPAHNPTYRPTVLWLYQLNVSRVSLVLYRVVHDQVSLLSVIEQWLHQLPQVAGCGVGMSQVVRDCIVADPFQVSGQVRTGVVGRAADQIFDVLLFPIHACTISYLP
jgi:hypothetical protein